MFDRLPEYFDILWFFGLIGSFGISAAGTYVYLFRKPASWSKYTEWISDKSLQHPVPYGLTVVKLPKKNEEKWWHVGLLAQVFSAGCLYVWLSCLGFDVVHALLGVWFWVWLAELFGRYTTEIGRPETIGFALILLTQISTLSPIPEMSVLFAAASALFLPIGPILAAAASWSVWPLVGLLVPLVQWYRVRSIEPDNKMPRDVQKAHRMSQKFGFGAIHSDLILSPLDMLFPWGPLGLLFLISIGLSTDYHTLMGAIVALVTGYIFTFWRGLNVSTFLLACIPVIACALMLEQIEWILLAAFLQPFAISQRG